MKKLILFALAALAALSFASCEKIGPEMTETADMAGQWYVQVDGAYNDGSEDWEDPFGMGRFIILTYNTAANKATEMFVNDLGTFWDFAVKVSCDPVAKTFSVSDGENLSYESRVTITDGKIVENGTTTPSGMPADYIEFYVVFDDDDYIPDYYDKLKFSGWRYTGFVNDD
ncbi:MAG: lipid-binding protein [Bacteroidia bacterium]|nr:lipid-binding protein [Bacteroidia bacterium]